MPLERSIRSWKQHIPPPVHVPNTNYPQYLASWIPPSNAPPFDPYAEGDGPPPLVEPPQESPDNDLPPLVDAPGDNQVSYFLSPLPEEAYTPTLLPVDNSAFDQDYETPPVSKPSHHKKRPPGHIPRPPNAFILYRAHFIKAQHIPGSIEPNNNTLSTIAGLCWKRLSEEERETWKEKARKAKEEHMKKYPTYRYNPRDQQNRARSAGSAKRKVKEISGPPPDPERCQEIARMLVEGKKGSELADAMKKFDASPSRTPGKQVVATRFDSPMTERSFRRRPSSVPPISREDEDSEEPQPAPTRAKPKRLTRKRSSSTGTDATVARNNKRATSSRSAKTEESDESTSKAAIDQAETPFHFYAGKLSVEPDDLSAHTSALGINTGIAASHPRTGHIIATSTRTSGSPTSPYPPPGPPDSPLTPVVPVVNPEVVRHEQIAPEYLGSAAMLARGYPMHHQLEAPAYNVAHQGMMTPESGGNSQVPGSFPPMEGWSGEKFQYLSHDAAGSYGGLGVTPRTLTNTVELPPPPTRQRHRGLGSEDMSDLMKQNQDHPGWNYDHGSLYGASSSGQSGYHDGGGNIQAFSTSPSGSAWNGAEESPRGEGTLAGSNRLRTGTSSDARSPTPPRGGSVVYPYMLELDMNVREVSSPSSVGRLSKVPGRQLRAHRSMVFQAI